MKLHKAFKTIKEAKRRRVQFISEKTLKSFPTFTQSNLKEKYKSKMPGIHFSIAEIKTKY